MSSDLSLFGQSIALRECFPLFHVSHPRSTYLHKELEAIKRRLMALRGSCDSRRKAIQRLLQVIKAKEFAVQKIGQLSVHELKQGFLNHWQHFDWICAMIVSQNVDVLFLVRTCQSHWLTRQHKFGKV